MTVFHCVTKQCRKRQSRARIGGEIGGLAVTGFRGHIVGANKMAGKISGQLSGISGKL